MITQQHIDEQIVAEFYHVFPGTSLTVCALKLRNGYVVVGSATSDGERGQKRARVNARGKIWQLEEYRMLTERIFND